MKTTNTPRRIWTLALLISTLLSPAAALAQTRRNGQVASNKASSAPKCSGAWTGTVSYKRSQSMSENKREERVSGRGHDTRNWEMKYEYSANAVVTESPEKNGSSRARATINHNFLSRETIDAVEKNSCDRGKTWKDMRGTSKSVTETSGTGTEEANVHVGMNSDGTYSVSIALPPIKGQTTGSQSSEYSGQCTKKEGRQIDMPATPTTIDGNSLTSPGTHKVDPSDPNRISGSYTHTWQNVTETIEWTLQRCGGPLRLTELKFADMVYPNWNEWRELNEQTGTIDGNFVKITAKVLNTSGETKFADVVFKETFKGDKWDGAKPDAPLEDSTISVRVEPGEEREVELMFDTSGYAWYDDGRPRLVQRVKAELMESGKKADEMTKNLKVAPKPLVLVHGLWSNWRAWESWQNILTTSHSYDWKAFPVGEKPEKGVMNTGGAFMSTDPTNTIAQNAEQLGSYIEYAQRDRNAWHVDIVAHSMGGLISRDYINRLMPLNAKDGRPKVSHLIMLGTPNMGSPCADIMNSAFELVGKKVEAVRQLRQDVAAEFNKVTRNRKGVKFSALAGDPIPTICYSTEWNDGVVTVPSAVWEVKDNARSKNVHTDLTGTADFSSFVKPRLAIGPKGNHDPDVQMPGATGMKYFGTQHRIYGASRFPMFDQPAAPYAAPWAKEAVLAPKASTEIEVPVTAGPSFGVTFMVPGDVSVTLLDERGAVVGKNLAGTPESNGWFRSIYINKAVQSGAWKLRIENTADRERSGIFTTWTGK